MESLLQQILSATSSLSMPVIDSGKLQLLLTHFPQATISWLTGIEGLSVHQFKVVATHIIKESYSQLAPSVAVLVAKPSDYYKLVVNGLTQEQWDEFDAKVTDSPKTAISWLYLRIVHVGQPWMKSLNAGLKEFLPGWLHTCLRMLANLWFGAQRVLHGITHAITDITQFQPWMSCKRCVAHSPKESMLGQTETTSNPQESSWFSWLVCGGVIAATAYGFYKWVTITETIDRQDLATKRPSHMQKCYEEVKARLEEESRGFIHDRMEDELTKIVIEPAEMDEDGKVLKTEVAQYLVKNHGRFVRSLVTMAKNEFAGVPKPTEANQLAVWRYLYRVCDKKGVNPSDTQKSISAALPFVFLPSAYDQDQAITMNCDDTKRVLERYADTFRHTTPLQKLVTNPLVGANWAAWARSIFISDPETGLRFAK